ncbi:sulfur carrier protein ThiS adenylyltransferase [Pseudobutyrivibrio sp. OR37]|uniref:thiamine biosynthesis protein ThiF n=1 Tax=Pseudobutyrivibrio sp. OR37 TaxID=1798186 RepID=UPI0008E9A876|nr:thiamine biosynthesis protein ThiF [Pseudobutyrivibrio sp. OR37]SFH71836.1 sulfur carrier protein ThiS adenylyltransferase [Pseudobutyrivibrio sp. OR37]
MLPTKEEFYEALVERHGRKNQEKFSKATVAICGLGGLGSNIAICLARAGVGKLILIDYDKVDVTNLHRQQYKANQVGMLKTYAMMENLMEINPYLQAEAYSIILNENNLQDILKEADIVCEAFDDARYKAMLVNEVLEKFGEKYILSSSGMAGFGSANLITTKKLSGRFYLCGDGVSDVEDGIGLVASRVMVCAAQEAHMVLRILMGECEP